MFKKTILKIGLLAIFLIFNSLTANAEKFNRGDIFEGSFQLNSKIKIDLPEGKWILVEKRIHHYYITTKIFTLVKVKDNKVIEGISIGEAITAGIHEDVVNEALIKIMFKNKYDGCYDRPEYSVLEFYRKGSTHNCFWVGHHDLIKHIYDPDDPEFKTENTQLKTWLKNNKIELPKVALYSEHSYFSRLRMGKWYSIAYIIDPKILNAPENKFITENLSEYHRNNIDNYPKHKKILDKWISISAQRHKNFEDTLKVLDRHKLELANLNPLKKITYDKNQINDFADQIYKLNELYKKGILTEEEFNKAKDKLLN